MLRAPPDIFGVDDLSTLHGGLQPAKVLSRKPHEHWRTLISLPEAREQVGVYGDASQDDLITRMLSDVIAQVEGLRGAGRPLTETNMTCFYAGLAERMLLDMVAPMPMLGSYSDLALVVNRESGDETVAESEYFLDDSGDWAALVVGDAASLSAAQYRRNVENPVRLMYKASPIADAPDWNICRNVVLKGLEMSYAERALPEANRGYMTVLARLMPNRVPMA